MKSKLLLLSLLFTIQASAQECNCPASFDWMISTFEHNDAGFQHVIDKKGMDEYVKHTTFFKEKAKTANTQEDCQVIMNKWLHYFRPGHIGAGINQVSDSGKQPTDTEIRQRYKDSPRVNLTEKQLITLLEKKKDKNPIEGVWDGGNYRIGIIAMEGSKTAFNAFIIKADSLFWMPGQIKAELRWAEEKNLFATSYFMRDHSKKETYTEFINKEKSLISMFGTYWAKEYPKSQLSKEDQLLVKISRSEIPFVEKISDKTVYLRIPSFAADQKGYIDSVLAKYDQLISSTPNLIIDIRNGTGGSDASYENILPYLYTQPIRGVGVLLYCTEMNAKTYETYSKQYDDTSHINYCNRVAAKMRANIGKFINMSETTFGIDTLDKVMPFPQKVGIICNQNNGSTDEQFLIDAKQSSKVKVFGRPTGGMLDISNMSFANSPDGKFSLGYCMSKSFRIPNYCIDGVGIQPDYFIDDAVDQNSWIEFTRHVLEQ
jgi:hypothetical protein